MGCHMVVHPTNILISRICEDVAFLCKEALHGKPQVGQPASKRANGSIKDP